GVALFYECPVRRAGMSRGLLERWGQLGKMAGRDASTQEQAPFTSGSRICDLALHPRKRLAGDRRELAHNSCLESSALPSAQPSDKQAARLILVLALAPAVGVGLCRFAYSLVLPDMRESLSWSYATAGLMNTVNAAGYLTGALAASPIAR